MLNIFLRRLERIEQAEHFPCFKHLFCGTCPKKIEHIEILSCKHCRERETNKQNKRLPRCFWGRSFTIFSRSRIVPRSPSRFFKQSSSIFINLPQPTSNCMNRAPCTDTGGHPRLRALFWSCVVVAGPWTQTRARSPKRLRPSQPSADVASLSQVLPGWKSATQKEKHAPSAWMEKKRSKCPFRAFRCKKKSAQNTRFEHFETWKVLETRVSSTSETKTAFSR